MKKYEIEEPITLKQLEKYRSHLRNSSKWYASSCGKTEREVEAKLEEKGFRNNVLVEDGSHVDLVDEAIEFCKNGDLFTDDYTLGQWILSDEVDKGNGPHTIKRKMNEKGLNEEAIKKCLDDIDLEKSLSVAFRKASNNPSVQKAEGFDKKMKMKQLMKNRGFDYGDVNAFVDWEIDGI